MTGLNQRGRSAILSEAMAVSLMGLILLCNGALSEGSLPELRILGSDYPRVFFFRASEGGSSRESATYEGWETEFDRLMGIMGKSLDEEVIGREKRNPEWFSRFKKDNPNQVVLLHFNGNARDPKYAAEGYFPGHWIYGEATRIVEDVPEEEGESAIRVEDARRFRTECGRYGTSNDDIGLFGMTPDGRHDWSHCEQVELLAVDRLSNTIRVRRGCYGTRPLAFRAREARAAAHISEGPWGKNNHLMWYYNFATHCPKDEKGKSCADRLVDDIASWFGAGGKLEAFDGLEFDVMFHVTHGDTDGDGVVDDGVLAGVNQYGIGKILFAHQLRERLGPQRIIQGDGALGPGGSRSQRAFGVLNGIESEGWPNLGDWEFDDWSGGLNRHSFWVANAYPPAFSYINHKWNEPVIGKPGEHKDTDVPFGRHRLVFAAAQFTDSMICYSLRPASDEQGRIGIWDEFVCGTEQRLGWLGKPSGPALRLAARKADLMGGIGDPARDALAKRITGPVSVRVAEAGVVIVSSDPSAKELAFSIPDLQMEGEDLTVFMTAHGEPIEGYPPNMARYAEVELADGVSSLLTCDLGEKGMALRGGQETPIRSESGARVSLQPNVRIGETVLPAVSIHPPYKDGKGYVYWSHDVDVSPDVQVRFSLGMAEKSPDRSDGVWYSVAVAQILEGKTTGFETIFEESTKAHTWLPRSVSLTRWEGRRIRLKFIADCGPKDDATTDQGFWGDVRIARAGIEEGDLMPRIPLMTWVNGSPFQSSFYFRGVRSKRVDLMVRIEGRESVTLSSITAHAAPDAQCRFFEHGFVLGNPSRDPYTFDLTEMAPNRTFRRLRATSDQDTQANSGERVGSSIILGPLEGLFLMSEKN